MRVVDREAEGEFVRTYEACYGRVHAYAARRLGLQVADDVTAETFMVAWRRIDAMPDEPLPWLYGIAPNIVLRQRASSARQDAVRRALGGRSSFAADDGRRGPRAYERRNRSDPIGCAGRNG